MFLRVGVTKYCKNQGNLFTRSVSAAAAGSWALLKQHRENPSVQALFGEIERAARIDRNVAFFLNGLFV